MVIFHCYVSSPEGSFSLEYIVVIGEKRKIQAPADPESVELQLNCVEFKHCAPFAELDLLRNQTITCQWCQALVRQLYIYIYNIYI